MRTLIRGGASDGKAHRVGYIHTWTHAYDLYTLLVRTLCVGPLYALDRLWNFSVTLVSITIPLRSLRRLRPARCCGVRSSRSTTTLADAPRGSPPRPRLRRDRARAEAARQWRRRRWRVRTATRRLAMTRGVAARAATARATMTISRAKPQPAPRRCSTARGMSWIDRRPTSLPRNLPCPPLWGKGPEAQHGGGSNPTRAVYGCCSAAHRGGRSSRRCTLTPLLAPRRCAACGIACEHLG